MALWLLAVPGSAEAVRIEGLARVTDTGTLVVAGREVALAGIDVPTFDRFCRRSVMPVRCGPRAVLVLDDMVSGFVHCDIVGERQGLGRQSRALVEARCTVAGRRLFDDRLDLAAELLRDGWAFARDDAPSLYRSLERLARSRKVGMWRDAAVELR